MELSAIHVYPIKGARGLSLAEADVGDRGLAGDRRFMVVDDVGVAITQREHPRLALVRPVFDGDALLVDAPGMSTLRLPRAPEGDRRSVAVWSATVDSIELGEPAAAWFSEALGVRCALVFMPDSARRPVKPKYSTTAIVSFADAFPFLLASESSLADLNARLDEPVPMDRFRPNLVVRGAPAWAEDHWDRVRIGPIGFSLPKPCDRCVVTTVDQDTGVAGREPLRTLATFRARDGMVWFGENLIHEARGTLRVGDRVVVL
ncbi:MAG: MOSC domain-containing protein [Deltaproteobacteria bacterium]|nr:MOSC domain-containing protein [Deltaproteobacteria bacterium]